MLNFYLFNFVLHFFQILVVVYIIYEANWDVSAFSHGFSYPKGSNASILSKIENFPYSETTYEEKMAYSSFSNTVAYNIITLRGSPPKNSFKI